MDEWQIKWINPQIEKTYQSYTLILIDNKGQSHRIEKVFDLSPLSEQDFEQYALKEIENIIKEQELNLEKKD